MIVNGKEYDINELTKAEKKNFYRRTRQGIMLNDEQREVLKRHGIDYNKCLNLQELLFQIEDVLNEENLDCENMDLEKVSLELADIYYYSQIHK